MQTEYIRKQDAVNALKAQADTMRTWVERYAEQRRGILTAVNIVEDIKPADVAPVVRCKDCIHNNDCDIQYSAQAGENFFCGFGETEKDERENVYE